MSGKQDFRDFVVAHPSCPIPAQREHLDGVVYEDFDKLLRSLRPGSIARIYRPYLLGGAAGNTRTRRRVWAERADKIKAKGNKLVSIDPPLFGAKLAMHAAEQIGNIARGKAGVSKQGRRKKVFTPEQLAIIHQHWPRRAGVTVQAAIAAINAKIKPKRVSYGWLYANVE